MFASWTTAKAARRASQKHRKDEGRGLGNTGPQAVGGLRAATRGAPQTSSNPHPHEAEVLRDYRWLQNHTWLGQPPKPYVKGEMEMAPGGQGGEVKL
jgi:hypothetical protein